MRLANEGRCCSVKEDAYDIRDDKALPNLQTATDKENADRYRALQLR
jgi:hypothetical protein